ncbi:MAG: amidohydrolase family protein, partial [Myxococcota bacterium]
KEPSNSAKWPSVRRRGRKRCLDRVELRRAEARDTSTGAVDREADLEPNRLPQGTLLGSRLTLDRAVHNVQKFAALGLCEAVAAGTARPARLLGVENKRGTLRRGARADLAVMDRQGRVVETWLAGRRVWSAA